MTTDPYAGLRTSETLETAGIYIDYGAFRVKIARAGGANKRFAKVLEQKLKPYRRQLQTETMDDKTADRLMREAFAETVVLGWEVKTPVDGKPDEFTWEPGVHDPDTGSVVPAKPENYIRVWASKGLADLFVDIREQAAKVALFREEVVEADAKN